MLSARATGVGRDLDVSLFDGALQNLAYLAVWYLNAGVNQGRAPRSGHPSLTPNQSILPVTGTSSSCEQGEVLADPCERIDRPDWAERPDYGNFEVRLANRARLTEELESVLSECTTTEWLERFAGQVPAAPVHDVAAALDNTFLTEQGRVRSVPHPNGGEIRLLAPPVSCPGEEMPRDAAPQLGADTDSILGQLGFAPGEIERLRKVGAV